MGTSINSFTSLPVCYSTTGAIQLNARQVYTRAPVELEQQVQKLLPGLSSGTHEHRHNPHLNAERFTQFEINEGAIEWAPSLIGIPGKISARFSARSLIAA
jgi:hypothetical protein